MSYTAADPLHVCPHYDETRITEEEWEHFYEKLIARLEDASAYLIADAGWSDRVRVYVV